MTGPKPSEGAMRIAEELIPHEYRLLREDVALAIDAAVDAENEALIVVLIQRADEQRAAFLRLRSEWSADPHKGCTPNVTWDASCLAGAKLDALQDAIDAIRARRKARRDG